MDQEDTRLAMRFGQSLKALRIERGWTQAQLAEAANTSVNHLGYMERGERLPSVPMLVVLARVLGTSASRVLGEQEEQDEPERERALGMVRSLPRSAIPMVVAMLHGARRWVDEQGPETEELLWVAEAKPTKGSGPSTKAAKKRSAPRKDR